MDNMEQSSCTRTVMSEVLGVYPGVETENAYRNSGRGNMAAPNYSELQSLARGGI